MSPRRYLMSLKKDYITLPEVAKALGIPVVSLYSRIRVLPPEELPTSHGAYVAGGMTTFALYSACDWCERHERYWTARQAQPLPERPAFRLPVESKKGGR